VKEGKRAPGVPLFVRIAAGYGLVLLVMLGIAAVTLTRMRESAAVSDHLSREDAPALQVVDDLKVQILNEQIASTRFEASTDIVPRGREDLLQPYFRAHDDIFGDLAALSKLEGSDGSDELTATLTQLRSAIQVVEAEAAREIATIRSGGLVGEDSAAELARVDAVRAMAAGLGDQLSLQIRLSAADAQKSASDSTQLVIVDSVLGLAAHAVGRTPITFRKEMASFLPLVECDPEQLKQVLLNVTINAIQAMQPNGGQINIKAQERQQYVYIEIEDQGCGVLPEYLDKIFDPFFTTKDDGTGLGLSVAYQILQQHDGMLTAARNSEQGMTFCVALPVKRTSIL